MVEPVNVAKPEWMCPTCGSKHGEDFASAAQCAEMGPPDGDGAAPTIVVWDHRRSGWDVADTMRMLHLDKVTADTENRRHVLRYRDQYPLPAEIGVGYQPGDVVELGGHTSLYTASAGQSELRGVLQKVGEQYRKRGEGKVRWPTVGEYGASDDYFNYSFYQWDSMWLGPLTGDVRQVFEVLFESAWEHLLAVDPATDAFDERHVMSGQFRWEGVTTRPHHSSNFDFHLSNARRKAACSHGFAPWDDPGITRWYAVHSATIDRWLHDRFYSWVRGDYVSIPCFSARPSIVSPGYSKGLPKKPNKRRVETLSHWGIEPRNDRWYNEIVEAALATLVAEPPNYPIPGVKSAVELRES